MKRKIIKIKYNNKPKSFDGTKSPEMVDELHGIKIGPGWRKIVNNEIQDLPLTMPVLKEYLNEIFFGWQDNPSPVWISKESAEAYAKMMGYNNLEEYLNMKEKHGNK